MDTFAWIFLAALSAMLGEATILLAVSHRRRDQRKLVRSPVPRAMWAMGACMLYCLSVLCIGAAELENLFLLVGALLGSMVGGGFAGIPLARWIVIRQNEGRRVADRLSIIPHLRD